MPEILPNTAGVEVVETSPSAPVASKAPEQTSDASVTETQEQVNQQVKESAPSVDESLNQNQKESGSDKKEQKSKFERLSQEDQQNIVDELVFKIKAAKRLGVEVVLAGHWLWTPKGLVIEKDSEMAKKLEKIDFSHHDQKNQCYFRNDLLKCHNGKDSERKTVSMEEIEKRYPSEQNAIAA